MAIYYLNLKTFGRTDGGSAVSAAAYRAGERIRDERSGRTYDHADRQDVMHKEIILPQRFAADDLSWAKDRANLWNTAESSESRKNARVAREYLVALPAELSADRRIDLVRAFSQELVERYKFALDVAIHAPRDFPGSDPRNFHAHLLATTREVAIEGLGAKTTLEWSEGTRREAGLGPGINELLHVRQHWASATNEALKEAHQEARIDHRSLQAQGVDREPRPQIPRVAFEMERRGYRSELAERLREEYQARVETRLQWGAQHETAQHETARQGAQQAQAPKSGEEVRRQAREDWLRYREAHAEGQAARAVRGQQAQAREQLAPRDAAERSIDDDSAL